MIKELKSSIRPGLLYAMLADVVYYGVIFALLLVFVPIFTDILLQVQQLSVMLNQLTPDMADSFISESSDIRFRMYGSICLVSVLIFATAGLARADDDPATDFQKTCHGCHTIGGGVLQPRSAANCRTRPSSVSCSVLGSQTTWKGWLPS